MVIRGPAYGCVGFRICENWWTWVVVSRAMLQASRLAGRDAISLGLDISWPAIIMNRYRKQRITCTRTTGIKQLTINKKRVDKEGQKRHPPAPICLKRRCRDRPPPPQLPGAREYESRLAMRGPMQRRRARIQIPPMRVHVLVVEPQPAQNRRASIWSRPSPGVIERRDGRQGVCRVDRSILNFIIDT